MILFDYICNGCRIKVTNQDMESFICPCGGEFKLDKGFMSSVPFEPHFHNEIGEHVTSWSDMQKKARAKGLVMTNDYKSRVREWGKARKNREEYAQETFARSGLNYKPGSNTKWSDKHNDFIPINRS